MPDWLPPSLVRLLNARSAAGSVWLIRAAASYIQLCFGTAEGSVTSMIIASTSLAAAKSGLGVGGGEVVVANVAGSYDCSAKSSSNAGW